MRKTETDRDPTDASVKEQSMVGNVKNKRFATLVRVIFFIFVAAGMQTVSAEDKKESDSLSMDLIRRLENISKLTGVEIKMSTRSEFNNQRMIINNVDTAWKRPNEESEAFNEADVMFEARPVKNICAKGIIRMRTDWTSFFSHPIDEIYSRWLSLDGDPLSWLEFNIGDYHTHYSPLSLEMPRITMAGEPENFRKRRVYEAGDYWITDSLRPLQGFNFKLLPLNDKEALKVDVQASRLQSVDGIDSRLFNRTMFDRYLFGLRADYQMPSKFTAALQTVDIFDNNFSNYNTEQTKTSNTLFGGTADIDIKGITKFDLFDRLNLYGEFNTSSWKKEWAKTGSLTVADSGYMDLNQDVQDNAFFAGITAGNEKWCMVDVRYLSTGKGYRALAAQSPSVNWAIQDAYLSNTYLKRETHFASGLYYGHFGRFATRYNPVCSDIYGRSDFENRRFGLDSIPVSIYSEVDLNLQLTNKTLDPVLPLGMATYDRSGVMADITGESFPFFNYTVHLALLSNSNGKQFFESSVSLRFERAVHHLSKLPLLVDAGVKVTSIDDKGVGESFASTILMSNAGVKVIQKKLTINNEKINNVMLSGGVEFPLYKSISWFGAVQQLQSTMNFSNTYTTSHTVNDNDENIVGTAREYRFTAADYRLKQLHFAAGFKITLSEKAELLFDYRLLQYKPENSNALVRTAANLGNDGSAIGEPVAQAAVEPYKQHLLEILLNYNF